MPEVPPSRASNLAVARMFEQIAQSLEAAGGQGHRLRAYRRAARGVAAAEPLEQLSAEGRLRDVHGIGPSLEALITEFLETGAMQTHQRLVGSEAPKARKAPVRALRLKPAMEAATQIVDLLQVESAVRPRQIEIAGDVRRRCDLVTGGIDIVAVPASGSGKDQALLDLLERLPNVVGVVGRNHAEVSVRLYDGFEVRLHLTRPESWGADLVRHTGTVSHVRRLEQLAGDHSSLKGATEEEVYRSLDLPWIAPELREDTGEVDAAIRGALPNLIRVEDLKGDLHCHTNWTDGVATLEDMATAARARGYQYMALTDHSRSLTITNGLSLERLEEARRLVLQLNHRLAPFVILFGTEMDILQDGALDYPDETLATLDYVSASIHSRFKQTEEFMTPRILRAVTHPLVHTLNHPHGRLLGIRPPYPVDMQRVIQTATAHGCALEVSADPARMDLDGGWARQVKAAGGRCTVSSDAHSTLDFENIWLGIGSARRGWLEPGDVLNTRPLDEFLAMLRRPRAGA